jgi:hypothetical protein
VILRISFLAIYLLLHVVSYGQTVKTNQRILEERLVSILDSLNISMPVDSSEVSLKVGTIAGEKRFFLKNRLIHYFSQKDITINSKNARLQFEVEQFNVKFIYYEENRRLFGMDNKLQRKMYLQFDGWLEDSLSGRALNYFSIDKNYYDYIDGNRIDFIEQSAYSFTRGRLITTSKWTKYIEPVIVVLSVATAVYLFFSLRT